MKVDLISSSQSQHRKQRTVTPLSGNTSIGTSSILSTGMGTSGDNMDVDAVIVSKGKLGDTSNVEKTHVKTTPSLSRARRSIFCSYWQHENHNTHDKVQPQQSRTIQRSKSPRCVLRHPQIQVYENPDQCNTHTNKQPQEDESKVGCAASGDTQNGPLREKEAPSGKSSSPYESRPLSLSSIWNSLPTIFMEDRFKVLAPRPIKSDPALDSKHLKSNLRKGRFSGGPVSRDTRSTVANVTFQPVIKVHPFEPPMDRWAESGWSKQFDS